MGDEDARPGAPQPYLARNHAPEGTRCGARRARNGPATGMVVQIRHRIRDTGDVAIAPISAVRVTGLQPVAPTAEADPYEDGLEAQVTTQVVPLQAADELDRVQAPAAADDAVLGQQSAFARAAAVTGTREVGAPQAPPLAQDTPGGNARMDTGFDPTPVQVHDPAPRSSHASALARAFAESR